MLCSRLCRLQISCCLRRYTLRAARVGTTEVILRNVVGDYNGGSVDMM